ncbi:MAG TPA: hypothetical protein VJX94_26760, partial [Stellaceae bacterium]|nr:hypothetical protein [Stellaceae bacterium]
PTLMVVGVVYLGSIPLTIRSYYRLKRAAEARKAEIVAKPEIVPFPGPGGEANATATEGRLAGDNHLRLG